MLSRKEVNRRKRRLRNNVASKIVSNEVKKICLQPVTNPDVNTGINGDESNPGSSSPRLLTSSSGDESSDFEENSSYDSIAEETSEISVDDIVEESRTIVTEPNTSIQEHNDLSDSQTTCTVLDLLESKDSPAVKEFLPLDDAEFDETSDITDSMEVQGAFSDSEINESC